MPRNYRVLVIGGGFFGMYIAEYLARQRKKVILCDKEGDFMQRASYANQARVHNGYHYPRSILTALRSRVSFPRFCNEFKDCIDSSFESYYMVGKLLGKVTAKQFEKFCHRIGAPCQPAPYKIANLVNPNLIEAVFSTVEYSFDAVKLKENMRDRLDDVGVEYRFNTLVESIRSSANGLDVAIHLVGESENKETVHVNQVFNCTYSMINYVLTESGLEQIPLKHEMTEICLTEVPDRLKGMAVTVMCGPFFSVMPFPPRGLHCFSHVRYTPHYEWFDEPDKPYFNAHNHYENVKKETSWQAMIHDAQRYMPILSECEYRESIWEVKTVLPRSEVDDSRPILFKSNHGLEGFHCIMGGKIDNVYDVIEVIEQLGLNQ